MKLNLVSDERIICNWSMMYSDENTYCGIKNGTEGLVRVLDICKNRINTFFHFITTTKMMTERERS